MILLVYVKKMLISCDILIGLCSIILLIYLYFTRNFDYWKKRGVPYRKPVFLFGNITHLSSEGETIGKSLAKFYKEFEGPYFGFFSFNKPQLVIKDPQIIRQILIKDFNVFPNRAIYSNEKIDPFLSSAIFGIKHPNWRPLRAKLSPVFSSGKMKMMFHLMNECGENLKNYIQTVLERDDLEIKEIIDKYTTDAIATCAFGIEANSFVSENSEFIVAGRRLFAQSTTEILKNFCYFFAPGVVEIFKFKFIESEAAGFLKKVFMETIRQRETLKNKRNDLVDILIDLKNKETEEDEYKFSDDRLVAQGILFFAAGHENTSITIGFTMHELCVNVDIQERLRKEIMYVIKRHSALTYEAVQDMKYLDMVVLETLRKYPVTPFILRECIQDYTIQETGLVVEKGTVIMIPQDGLQWDPKYFPNPEKYDLERFSDENKHKIPPYVFLPFGDGPRICIGERFALLSTKLGIIHIIKNFKVIRNSRTVEPMEFGSSPLLRAKDGIRLTFKSL